MVSGPACENRKMTEDPIGGGIEKDRAVIGEDEEIAIGGKEDKRV